MEMTGIGHSRRSLSRACGNNNRALGARNAKMGASVRPTTLPQKRQPAWGSMMPRNCVAATRHADRSISNSGRSFVTVMQSADHRDADHTSLDRRFDGRVEMWRGGVGRAYPFPALSVAGASVTRPCSVSTSRSSNRTCGFAASGSPTGSYDRHTSARRFLRVPSRFTTPSSRST